MSAKLVNGDFFFARFQHNYPVRNPLEGWGGDRYLSTALKIIDNLPIPLAAFAKVSFSLTNV